MATDKQAPPGTETSRQQSKPKKIPRKQKMINMILIIFSILGVGLISLYTYGVGELHASRKYRILVPLYASSQEYLDYMGLPNGHYDDYKRKVSLDMISAIEAAKKAWFKNKPTDLPREFNLDTVDFYYYPEGYDEASYKSAFDRAMEIASKDGFEVVGVIGHITSSVTQACGKFYGEEKLPIILPLATATNLTTYLKGTCEIPAILRLLPNNAKQAELISKFLSDKGAYRAILVKDLSNPAYSDDLIEGFRDYFVRQPFEKESEKGDPSKIYAVKHGRILGVIPAGGQSGAPLMHSTLKDLNIDAFILVGMTEFTLESLAQARALNLKTKFTILTDGAVDEYLLPRANSILLDRNLPFQPLSKRNATVSGQSATLPLSDKVYMAFPLETPMPDKLKEGVLVEDKKKRNLEMTHALYIADAAQIMLSILGEEVVKGGYTWLKKSRTVVAETIDGWNTKQEIMGVKFTYDDKRMYRLDGAGNSKDLEYHLYSTSLPSYSGGNQKVNWDMVKWAHDKDCPVEIEKRAAKSQK
jgi:hypothetical protein